MNIEQIRVRIMSEAYDLADRNDSEGYNSVKVMCSDVLKLIDDAIAAEREACARVCETLTWEDNSGYEYGIADCAAAIRARGGEPEPSPTPQERTPDYLEKCPNCNGPADNGFDRSWPDANPYFCTKCMKAMEY